MKKIMLILMFTTISVAMFAGKLDSMIVSNNGVDYTIKLGDQLQLGYGKNPNGSFQYVEIGVPAQSMSKDGGGKTGVVTMIRYFKAGDYYEVNIKIKGMGTYGISISQAMAVGELVGINDVIIPKE